MNTADIFFANIFFPQTEYLEGEIDLQTKHTLQDLIELLKQVCIVFVCSLIAIE